MLEKLFPGVPSLLVLVFNRAVAVMSAGGMGCQPAIYFCAADSVILQRVGNTSQQLFRNSHVTLFLPLRSFCCLLDSVSLQNDISIATFDMTFCNYIEDPPLSLLGTHRKNMCMWLKDAMKTETALGGHNWVQVLVNALVHTTEAVFW